MEEDSTMRISNTAIALSASVALAMLVACAGSGSQIAPTPLGPGTNGGSQFAKQQSMQIAGINDIVAPNTAIASSRSVTARSFFDPSAKAKPLIFVSDRSNNVVNIYLQAGANQKMVGQITGLNYPQGLAIDASRNLYIVDGGTGSGGNADVLVYAPPYTGAPKLTLADPGYEPNGVTVSPMGVVAVANYCTFPSCSGAGNVTFYAKNSTTPCATIADPSNPTAMLFDAFDQSGDLYVDGFGSGRNAAFDEITGGCNAKTITLLTTSNHIGVAEGMQVDKAHHIAILDESDAIIYAYSSPKNGSLGNPVSTTRLLSNPANNFAFLASGSDLYAVYVFGGVANEYDYPSGGAAENAIAVGGAPWGVAVTPPLVK
jgi:hypothetical protein